MLPDARRGQNRAVYIQRMNCAERVDLDVRESNRNYLEIVGTWDERIVMVADDEDFLEWQRDWLTDNGRG